jgi:putative transposase
VVSPAARREVVRAFRERFAVSERRACDLAGLHRSVQRYRSVRRPTPKLVARLEALAAERPRFGYCRLTVMLRREGFDVNHKRVWRLYRERGLAVRRKTRKRASQAPREALPATERPHDTWSMDFLSDALADGRGLRFFAVVDDHSRQCIALDQGTSLPAERVLRMLDRAIEQYGAP